MCCSVLLSLMETKQWWNVMITDKFGQQHEVTLTMLSRGALIRNPNTRLQLKVEAEA